MVTQFPTFEKPSVLYNTVTVLGGNSFIRVIEHNGRFIQTMDECADVMNELQRRLAEADELKEKFKTAMATYELTGFDDSLWELLDAITKGE